jgi:hypothetical protein
LEEEVFDGDVPSMVEVVVVDLEAIPIVMFTPEPLRNPCALRGECVLVVLCVDN